MENPLGLLKMRSMLEAQKAVAHLRRTRQARGDKERLGKAEEVGRTVEEVQDRGMRETLLMSREAVSTRRPAQGR